MPKGLKNQSVLELYRTSRLSGMYEYVFRRDWAGRTKNIDMAYCMVNHKEFFAEMSVAYLSRSYEDVDNDIQYIDLKSNASSDILKLTPPLCSPTVLASVVKKYGSDATHHLRPPPYTSFEEQIVEDQTKQGNHSRERNSFFYVLISCFTRKDERQYIPSLPVCNKFFPFTSAQFAMYDKELYLNFAKIWDDINYWNDPCENDFLSTMFCLK